MDVQQQPEAAEEEPECWTLFSTAAYGKDNKVPH
jgi:hypothetical protein